MEVIGPFILIVTPFKNEALGLSAGRISYEPALLAAVWTCSNSVKELFERTFFLYYIIFGDFNLFGVYVEFRWVHLSIARFPSFT